MIMIEELNQYVDKFIICEAKFSHSGRKKKLNFDIKKFSKFRDKIEYIILENEPEGLIYEDKNTKNESFEIINLNKIYYLVHVFII